MTWAIVFLWFSSVARASEGWTCLESANFELYTTAGEKTGRDALRVFEQIRSAFTGILGVKLPQRRPVTIIAFRDGAEYEPYRFRVESPGYYLSRQHRDFIVVQDLLPEHYPILLHEYTHLVINQAGMKLPLWLEEGFADLYSTMTPAGGKILVGRVMPERLQLARSGLMDLRELLRADRRSTLYHEGGRLGIFYAESWALVHMLKFSPDYGRNFDRFLDAIGQGQASDRALQQVYARSIERIQSDLSTYVQADRFSEGVIKGKFAKVADPVVVKRDPVETAVMLTSIAAQGPHRDAAIKSLQAVAKANPESPLPVEALAWMFIAGPSPEAAIEPFRKAFALHTLDADLCVDVAVKLRSRITEDEYVKALLRATEVNPGLSLAQKLLAAYFFNRQNYAEAYARLHLVKNVERAEASAYYRALSVAAFQVGNREEAMSAASRAVETASSSEERSEAERVLRFVGGPR